MTIDHIGVVLDRTRLVARHFPDRRTNRLPACLRFSMAKGFDTAVTCLNTRFCLAAYAARRRSRRSSVTYLFTGNELLVFTFNVFLAVGARLVRC
ncbi:MAG: hypothetical protein MZU97_05080 [Bacillus subtilis]|nr:hypothetical protein [Bacillus subtilis]